MQFMQVSCMIDENEFYEKIKKNYKEGFVEEL